MSDVKKYTVCENDYGPGYILHFEDDTYALVNVEAELVRYDSHDALMTMGFWREDGLPEITDELLKKIDAVLEKGELG